MNVKPRRQRIQDPNSSVPIILVVEDEEDNLLYISHLLIFLKYDFITATKGQDALDLATNYEIDLVLLDLVLPDMNGFELIELLKQNNATKDMPIIAVSALVEKHQRDRALELGCDDYLDKPFFIDDLERKIKHFLPKPFFRQKSPKTQGFGQLFLA